MRTTIVVKEWEHVKEPVGQGRFKGTCAALVQHFGCHVTSTWRRGALVKGNTKIQPGTCIATFEGNRYANRAHGNHAAIYVSQSPKSIKVYDQWRGRKPGYRPIPFDYPDNGPSNNGDAFSIILTPVFKGAAGFKYAETGQDPVVRYKIEDKVKDPSVKRALSRALRGDGRLSFDEIQALIRSTYDGKVVTKREIADLKVILGNSKTIDAPSRALIQKFLRNPRPFAV